MRKTLIAGFIILSSCLPVRSDEAPANTKVVTIAPRPWNATPDWQKAPDGQGEYLPNPTPLATFEIAGREYAATALGTLVREKATETTRTPGPWRIVPELYLRHLEPVGTHDELLWAVEGKPWRSRLIGEVSLLGLDPKDWSTKKTLRFPAGSLVVKMDKDGFWILREDLSIPRNKPGYTSLTCCDFDGKERFRFDAATLTTTEPPEPWMFDTKPRPLIYWMAIDDDAIYLSVIDYRGTAPNDGMIYGPKQLVRIDRVSGKHTAADAPIYQTTTLANAPGRVLWLHSTMEDGKVINTIYQMNKKTMEMSCAGVLDAGYLHGMTVKANHLWVQDVSRGDRRLRVFSLDDFKEVPVPGEPPTLSELIWSPRWRVMGRVDERTVELLRGDRQRVWLSSGTDLMELREDGTRLTRDLSGVLGTKELLWPLRIEPGVLFVAGAGQKLLRVQADTDRVLVRDPQAVPGLRYGFMDAGGNTLWVSGPENRLDAFTKDLIPLKQFTGLRWAGAFAATRDAAYYFTLVNKIPVLLRADPESGQTKVVESWSQHAREWFKRRSHVDVPPPNDLWIMGSPIWMKADDSGNLQILHTRPTDPRVDPLKWDMMLWTYDAIRDTWKDQDVPDDVQALTSSPGLFYDTKQHAVVTYLDGKWVVLGKLSEHWFDHARDFGWRVHATDKHLYAWTPLGLWRTRRPS